MSTLFSPLTLGQLTLRNRIAVSPMCEYSAKDGQATDWHMIHLGHLALSGAGILFTEATAVEPEGRITYGDLGLYSDATEVALGKIIRAIRRYSNIPVAIQLAHAGRKASCKAPWEGGQRIPSAKGGWQTMAPSAIPFIEDDDAPLALDAAALRRIRDAFVTTTKRAVRLGVDAVEIHAAHGYLLHEFLSPLSNRRTDQYGGALENRMRLTLEIYDAVRAALPTGKPVGVRISATDWVDGGWDIDQSVVLAKELARRGCAFIDVSSGGLSSAQKIPVAPGYQVPFAERIRREAGLATMAVGMITEPEQAEAIVASGQADMVALARAMLYDPRWPWHAAAKLGAQVEVPPQYWRSQPQDHKNLFSDRVPGQR